MNQDSGSGNTTQQEPATYPGGGTEEIISLRWVFPASSLTTAAKREPILLGRAAECDVVIPGAETSRHHAELFHRGPIWVVRDLGSRNGVYVNGRRVELEALATGDILRVGEWVGVVRLIANAERDEATQFRELAPGVYGSSVLANVLKQAEIAAASDLRIVVEGETGTGKECVAHAIHRWSGRGGPFVAVNCAALPESLAEGELFGYRRGAFTGADRASVGHLRAAHGGTLLLDEITDLPLSIQAKLLRALEQRAVVPLGESMPIPIDVRVVAASQESLRSAVEQNRFRADLWARLDGLTIVLPPLRKRSEDAPALFAQFLAQCSKRPSHIVEPRLIEQLCLYDWPGNVRELAQLARQLSVIRAKEPVLRRSHLPERMLSERRSQLPPIPIQERGTIAPQARAGVQSDAVADEADLRREEDLVTLMQALRLHHGNVALAARELGISRQKAYRRLEALPDMTLDSFRSPRRRSLTPKQERGSR